MNSPQYITDDKGKKLSVILPIKDYKKIMEELEDLEDMRLYDEGMLDTGKSIPADTAFKSIEANRKKK
jgi:hypothetical protein